MDAFAFKNMAFLANRFLSEGMNVQEAIAEALDWEQVQTMKPMAFLATEVEIVAGIEAHLGATHDGTSTKEWFGNKSREDKRAIFEVVSGIFAKLRDE